ncbi:MAG: chitobiase/beta-hexosaminidase C-terminal domain-containing protein [Chitinophagaceae bacterium]|nr:chitobiase/beta-hexosaminidase C-terminal domain-containing protein [Chitinophagaceae bacterium]
MIRRILFSALVPLNCLLVFFLLVEDRIVVPSWLQVFGRMHPLLLHFPIALLVFVTLFILVVPASKLRQPVFDSLLHYLLLIVSLTAVVTALMGFFLSNGGEYANEVMAWHKWTGVALPIILFLVCIFRVWLIANIALLRGAAVMTSVLLVIAGHYGATLTHGENYVLMPVTNEDSARKLPPFDEALVFADLVQPILEDKCMSCHNTNKAKGQLIMETKALLLKGGRGGKPWDTSKTDLGLMMKRVHLPVENKKHMPPANKPQLTADEITVIEGWIRQGADFEKKIIDLSTSDTLYMIARKTFGSGSEEIYTFKEADESDVQQLSNPNRIIVPLAEGSPALRVHFFNSAGFSDASIDELLPLKDNIVEISLAKMPVKDDMLSKLTQFKELRKLNLNETQVTGSGLSALAPLPALKSISLAGSPVIAGKLGDLASFASLKNAFLWNTSVTQQDLLQLEKENRKAVFNLGFSGDTTVLQLTPPQYVSEKEVFGKTLPVKLRHYINGAAIRYTVDGTEPDSVNSRLYTEAVILDKNTMIKSKAFKKGWIASDVVQHFYFKQTYVPDSAVLVGKHKKPDVGTTARMLIDGEKSEINFSSGMWLGFRDKPMECMLYFNKPVKASNITVSYLMDISASIMPPQDVQFWVGTDERNLKLLSTQHPRQPTEMLYREILPVECNFPQMDLQVIKIIVKPLPKLPEWHQQKGGSTAFYIDEVFVN